MRAFFRPPVSHLGREHTLAKFIRLHGLLNHALPPPPPARSPLQSPCTRRALSHMPRVIIATAATPASPRRFLSVFSIPLYRPNPAPSPSPSLPSAPAVAGNGSAYFIFRADRIDNLQRRYVNAPSRSTSSIRASRVFLRPSSGRERTGTQPRIKGGCWRVKAKGFVGARSLGKMHCETHSSSRALRRKKSRKQRVVSSFSLSLSLHPFASSTCMRCICMYLDSSLSLDAKYAKEIILHVMRINEQERMAE